ncbi:hypothetical protein J416_07987 [Gracilibacillus halophilus YIM-C55.5]|uniref:DUF4190 domain-containing protein n=1 Tax=Gracilibacillus halophilus YIM-C55.5 TaxID=1308866 RepID=N4WV96_9BACI|nr:DUF4190 domain-containing protein [Gracilibacillus halophilus]ENH97001.1 hypothetical protein J416_07987 [Gracilibacillus halophilus YIM-C55.5]
MSQNVASNNSETNGKSIASLILGILSIIFIIIPLIGLILGIVGFILGIVGLSNIKRFEQNGRNLAISGVICSGIGIILPIVSIIIALLMYG